MAQPIQPLAKDEHGVLRFKPNLLVLHLLDNGGLDLNDLAMVEASAEDRQQFAQLIGYSLSGYGTLSYVTSDAYGVVATMVNEKVTEEQARILYLEQELAAVRASLREPIARLYGVHPSDLGNGDD